MLAEFIATGFFVGRIPFAPGTLGTLLGIPLVLIFPTKKLLLGAIVVLFILGWVSAHKVIQKKKNPDPEEVVIDEIVGYLASFLFVEPTYKTIVLAFILFRVIDVFKPFPVNLFEKFPGALGVMADDFAGGVLTSLILFIIL